MKQLKAQIISFTTNKPYVAVGLATLFVLICRYIYLYFSPLDLAPDEAHYWEWSRRLDLSYYSKPPMVAWLMALSTKILDHTMIGVRLFSVMAQAVLMLLTFDILKRAKNNYAAWLGWLLLLVTPMFSAGGLLMTPDVPSLTFYATGLWIVTRINWDEPDGQFKLFIALGVALGLAGLSKYTTAFFYPLLGLFLLVNKTRWQWFTRPELYFAGLVSLLMTTPVFIWNAMNDWVGFKHVMGQASGESVFEPFKTLGNFLGGELGVVGPIVFVMMLIYWVCAIYKLWQNRAKKSEKTNIAEILFWFSAPLFVFFILKSLGGKVQPNWPVLAVFVGLLGLALFSAEKGRVYRYFLIAGIALSSLITVVAHDTFIVRAVGIDYPAKKDPLKPVLGWRGLGDLVRFHLMSMDPNTAILTTRYQTASELAFYARRPDGFVDVLYVNTGGRRQNQYDYWEWPDLKNRLVLYVNEGHNLPEVVKNGFEECVLLRKVASTRKEVVLKVATIYLCVGYKGIERVKPDIF